MIRWFFPQWRASALQSLAPQGEVTRSTAQRLQNPLVKEYPSVHSRNTNMSKGIFLNQGVLESLGVHSFMLFLVSALALVL